MDNIKRIKELEACITRYQNSYYNGEAEISDEEFDALCDELRSLDPDNPILTKKIGTDSSNGFAKVSHDRLMGSQNKANSKAEMAEWIAKSRIKNALVGWKMDGASLRLYYKDGKFVQAVTRGTGLIGDDVTENARKMNGVPKELNMKFTGSIRGEVLVSKENKDKYFKTAKNCRAAANGTLKRKDGAKSEYLDVVVYDAWNSDKSKLFDTQEELMTWLEENNFNVAKWELLEDVTPEVCMKWLENTFGNLDQVPYDIDGLVFKKNEIDIDDLNNNPRPKTQIALKPERSFATSTVIGIRWENTNGSFTPVLLIEPTELLGAEIKNVNAYNIQFLLNMKIEIGDHISFTRFGEIIPGVARNLSKGTVNPKCA